MPEGHVHGWQWMLRRSDARRSTYRGAGWAVTRVIESGRTYWCFSVDGWWTGARLELRRETA